MQPVMTMVDRAAERHQRAAKAASAVIADSPAIAAAVEHHCMAGAARRPARELLFGRARPCRRGVDALGSSRFAQHGTIMLDEIGEMPQALQAKILHVLQDREFTKLGSNRSVEVDVRVIAATNRDLEQMMRQGTFREDLYYRLQVIEVHVPPLRERREEIPQLIEFFLLKFASVYHRPAVRPSIVLQDALLSYDWPGNIRELENMMKRLVVLQDENLILAELGRLRTARANAENEYAERPAPTQPIPQSIPMSRPVAAAPPPPAFSIPAPVAAASGSDGVAVAMGADGVNLQELARTAAMGAEKEAIQHALERFRWNRRKTAEYLQVSYKTLLNKMKECGISESPNA